VQAMANVPASVKTFAQQQKDLANKLKSTPTSK